MITRSPKRLRGPHLLTKAAIRFPQEGEATAYSTPSRHSWQRSFTIWPAPWHAGQVRVIVKNPDNRKLPHALGRGQLDRIAVPQVMPPRKTFRGKNARLFSKSAHDGAGVATQKLKVPPLASAHHANGRDLSAHRQIHFAKRIDRLDRGMIGEKLDRARRHE